MLEILSKIAEELLLGQPSNKTIAVHFHTYTDATSPKKIDFHLAVQ